MTVPTHFHMPGGFNREGVHPGLFRPPISPSSSTSYGYASPRSTATPDGGATKRKRHCHDISRSQEFRLQDDNDRQGYFGTPVAQIRNEEMRYQLGGQLDTPNSGPFDSGILGESMYSDSDYRRALGSKRTHHDIDQGAGPTQLFNLPPEPIPSQSWGSFVFSTIGGVVGRAWEFCKTGSFRGFQAGGGTAFAMNAGKVEELDQTLFESRELPTRFPPPQDDYFNHPPDNADQEMNSGASTPTAPHPKRRHTDNKDELGRNWVMVSDEKPAEPEPEPKPMPMRRPSYRPSNRPRNSGPSMTTGRRISAAPSARFSSASTPGQRRSTTNRPASRLSHGVSPSPRPASTASFASFAPLAPVASPRMESPSRIPQPTFRRNAPAVSSPITKTPSHRRSHSNASVASGRVSAEASPRLTTEAKHLAARRKMEERDADVRINAFNKQLQDMIRQGREALGTTIEVEGNWDDEL
ncbi:hypothetical protein F53441_9166 [Fusarium austroafricanum]|uniref:Uncharacterized protein n=1 Tax=Fusarium austroafricanum TaxID=2364996 RepID=A0A8H4KDZ4_9HYPO|nr:hypothetical protein F53441_9166 [Fusarium austroafricanum]